MLSYLEIKKNNFYKVESTVSGKTFVTARGWDDLSQMIRLYEQNGLKVDEKLVRQYLQEKTIARDFAVYYDLFNKYRSDYQIGSILDGTVRSSIKGRAIAAKFDERLALLGLLLEATGAEMRETVEQETLLTDYMNAIKALRIEIMLSLIHISEPTRPY